MCYLLALSYGVHPVCLDVDTNSHVAIGMRLLVEAGMVEKDERVITVADESAGNLQEAFLIKIIKA